MEIHYFYGHFQYLRNLNLTLPEAISYRPISMAGPALHSSTHLPLISPRRSLHIHPFLDGHVDTDLLGARDGSNTWPPEVEPHLSTDMPTAHSGKTHNEGNAKHRRKVVEATPSQN